MGKMSIREALLHVVNHPEPDTDIVLDVPVSELVARTLYDIANDPNTRVRGALSRSRRAQKIIANRTAGLRKAGTRPATQKVVDVAFVDLTQGVLE